MMLMNHSTSFNLLGKAGHQPIQPLLLFVSLLIDFVKPVFNSFCYSHCYRHVLQLAVMMRKWGA